MNKKISFISNYNFEPLERMINAKSKILKSERYNYGTFDHQLKQKHFDYIFVIFDTDSIFYEIKSFLEGKKNKLNYKKLNFELNQFCKKIEYYSKNHIFFIFSFIKYNEQPFLSYSFFQGKNSIKHILNYVNNFISEKFSGNKNVNILDLNDYLIEFEGEYHDLNYYIATKSYFTLEFYEFFLKKIENIIKSKITLSKKLLLLDLDDTLWGGTVGEIGFEKLNIGGNDIYGESFQSFQKNILLLKKNGIQLGIVSKNEKKIALNAIQKHPEMILKEKDFSIIKINWRRKVDNIIDISKELNLGLDSFVFFDNDHHEREDVKENLPDVLVPDLSSGPIFYSKILNNLNCFENNYLTSEDKNRTTYYNDNFKRNLLLKKLDNKEHWINQLKIKINIEEVNKKNTERTIQLLNKTNQMNMRTIRYSENEFKKKYLSTKSKDKIYVANVRDKFGSYGLTGIISYKCFEKKYEVEDFVLSCRVMGRGVEETLINYIKKLGKKEKKQKIIFRHLETKKNKPMLNFLTHLKSLKMVKKNIFEINT
tara:strand:+ start:1173 stop:2786 length:1614 start_codon:yes stop_codon:yes gene_type:complete